MWIEPTCMSQQRMQGPLYMYKLDMTAGIMCVCRRRRRWDDAE